MVDMPDAGNLLKDTSVEGDLVGRITLIGKALPPIPRCPSREPTWCHLDLADVLKLPKELPFEVSRLKKRVEFLQVRREA